MPCTYALAGLFRAVMENWGGGLTYCGELWSFWIGGVLGRAAPLLTSLTHPECPRGILDPPSHHALHVMHAGRREGSHCIGAGLVSRSVALFPHPSRMPKGHSGSTLSRRERGERSVAGCLHMMHAGERGAHYIGADLVSRSVALFPHPSRMPKGHSGSTLSSCFACDACGRERGKVNRRMFACDACERERVYSFGPYRIAITEICRP